MGRAPRVHAYRVWDNPDSSRGCEAEGVEFPQAFWAGPGKKLRELYREAAEALKQDGAIVIDGPRESYLVTLPGMRVVCSFYRNEQVLWGREFVLVSETENPRPDYEGSLWELLRRLRSG